ncbi:LytTR family transcriptional regulator [Pedobacter psychrodurus]|uniref:LytTR family transcriptional regulator n=1 Tax=Pedobacter psychrodurus TaxID=2530456 RepID=A0A4R0Q4F5_9SPHI|nr:LytTR family transcriptional regulator [Pedobacter psychrodurus]
MELQLLNKRFLRIHRSFLAAIDSVNAFNTVTIEINNYKLPIGRSYRKIVHSVLSNPYPSPETDLALVTI